MKTRIFTLVMVAGLAVLPACSKADAAKPVQSPAANHQELGTKITHVNAVQSSAWIKKDADIIVLDIRTPKEFNSGHIDGAININFYDADFASQLSALDMSKDYVVHCRSGGRSGKSLATFKNLGFKHIVHMDGGMKAWNKARLPIVK
ncbi:MAG: rhodanese-like domain-containing protein [Robiginitomaculum sp.]|nr:rhodanese-like domain-containing protein [Robiginitomaculum sp.]